MENLIINATKSTPQIICNINSHLVEISGVSYPENTSEFYSPVIDWLVKVLDGPGEKELRVHIDLVYFNSSSSKVLLDLLEMFDEATGNGKKIKVIWFYDEENTGALKYGTEFKEDLEHLPFFVQKKDKEK